MTEQTNLPNPVRRHAENVARKAVGLTAREYLPMSAAVAFWALCAVTIGHADAARLLAATVLVRAVAMLVDLSTIGPIRSRALAPTPIRLQSRRNAALMQLASLSCAAVIIAASSVGLRQAGQDTLAFLVPLAAVGLPGRALRGIDPKLSSHYFRLILSLGALGAAGVVWAIHGGPEAMAVAFGIREWIAVLVVRLFRLGKSSTTLQVEESLRFAEVARTTVVTSRRLLTYRLTKNILAVFGPFGNFAARTGRGMNWHSRLEPYMPHRRSGFALFALATGGGAVLLAARSGEPSSMIVAAGLFQLCAIALNVLLLWRYLPVRDDPDLVIDDSEDE